MLRRFHFSLWRAKRLSSLERETKIECLEYSVDWDKTELSFTVFAHLRPPPGVYSHVLTQSQ